MWGKLLPASEMCGFQHKKETGNLLSLSEQALASQVLGGSKPRATSQLIPRQECFLSGIVFFSSLQARSAAPTPILCTGSRTLVLAGLDTPTSPGLSINATSKGPTNLAVMQVLRGKERPGFHSRGLRLSPTSAFTF